MLRNTPPKLTIFLIKDLMLRIQALLENYQQWQFYVSVMRFLTGFFPIVFCNKSQAIREYTPGCRATASCKNCNLQIVPNIIL